MQFRLSDVAAACRGKLIGPDIDVAGASIDSRVIRLGQLFIPIVAARDGHDFIHEALAGGAAAYLTARSSSRQPAVVVDDTLEALGELGAAARQRLPARAVIGITGSVGKTTVKDLTAAALKPAFRATSSPGNYNNELGVPLTLVNAREDSEVAVIEMGARGSGDVEALCTIARPTIGVVTAVGLAHTEQFGTIDDVARAKAELVEALPTDGIAVLNADDPRVAAMASHTATRVLTFGSAGEVTASAIAYDDLLRPSFTLCSPWGAVEIRLPLSGAHHVANALAAAGTALAVGAGLEDVATGIASADMSPWRMEVRRASSGAIVVNDAYNASPTATAAALHSLVALPRVRRHIAVLGFMAELGDIAGTEHRRVTKLAEELGVVLVAVDTDLYGVRPVSGVEGVLSTLSELDLRDGDAVLVKASRVAGLERVAAALLS